MKIHSDAERVRPVLIVIVVEIVAHADQEVVAAELLSDGLRGRRAAARGATAVAGCVAAVAGRVAAIAACVAAILRLTTAGAIAAVAPAADRSVAGIRGRRITARTA